MKRHPLACLLLALLAGCASGPPVPDWQANAKSALDDAVQAHLQGDDRAEARAFGRARAEIASTGQLPLMARAELMRCAARVASLEFGACQGFEPLRADADAAERAYAAYLAGQPLAPAQIELLPPAQRATAQALPGGAVPQSTLQAIEDPLSRLIAIAVLFQAGQASPDAMALAADTASVQGWRRPLLAWLKLQALRATQAGNADTAQRLQRRIELVERGR